MESEKVIAATPLMRTDVYSIHGLSISISWPDPIPNDELADVLLWIDLVKRKISRLSAEELDPHAK